MDKAMTDKEMIDEALAWCDDDILPTEVQQLLREVAGRLSNL